jgi:flagellar export protein FliJ
MRTFRFRLAALQRIKRHRIEEKEREIARLQAEIDRRLGEIEEGRRRLADLRRIFLEETPEIHFIEVERTEAVVRAYVLSVEAVRFREIAQLRKEQERRRNELIALYQEEKMLERLRDRQRAAWQQETQREEIYLLDEMGGQRHLRRREPAGGVMLYVLGVLALVAVAAAILVVQGKHKPILERVGLLKPPVPQAAPPEIPSATSAPGEYTIRDLYGDPDRPANVVLSNLLEVRKSLQDRERRIQEEEARLKAEREALVQSEEQLAGTIERATTEQKKLADLKKAQDDDKTNRYTQRVTEISSAIQRMKPKSAADLLTEMWKAPETVDPDAKRIVLEVFKAIPGTKRNKILDALTKSSKAETADMVLKFIQSEGTPTPTPVATSPPAAEATSTPSPVPTS